MSGLLRILAVSMVLLALATMGWASGQDDSEGDAAMGKPITLVAWVRGGVGFEEWLNKVGEEYTKQYPNVTIVVEPQAGSHSDYGAKLRLSFRSGTGPDIIHEPHDVNLTTLMSAGFTAPAPAQLAAMFDKESVDGNVRAFHHLNGDLDQPVHAAILTWQCQQYFYNKDYLREAGLPEKAPATRDEFREYARKMTVTDANGNITRAGYTFKMPNPHWHMSPWVFGAGGTYLNPEQTAAAVTTPEGRRAWERAMQYIYDITWVDKSGDFGAGNPVELFYNGQVAIHAEGIYHIANMKKNAPDIDYLMGNIPRDIYSSAVMAVGGIAVSAKSPNPDDAWRFIAYSLEPEMHVSLFDPETFSSLPPYKETVKLREFDHPDWKTALKQENRRMRMQGLGANEAWQEVGRAVEAYLSQAKTLDQSLDDLADVLAKIMKDRPISELKVPYTD